MSYREWKCHSFKLAALGEVMTVGELYDLLGKYDSELQVVVDVLTESIKYYIDDVERRDGTVFLS
jgi:hypothetical protein